MINKLHSLSSPLLLLFSVLLCNSAIAGANGYKDPNPEIIKKAESIAAALKPAQSKKERKVLIYGISHGPHRMVIPTCRKIFELLGEKTGAYEPVVSEDLANFEPENLKQFDAVVFANTTGEIFCSPIDKVKFNALSAEEKEKQRKNASRLAKNLDDYLRAGGGFVGIHGATDSLKSQETYTQMIGGIFWGHPWGVRNTVTLKVEDLNHALIKDVFTESEFKFNDEIYQFRDTPCNRDRLCVLLSLDLAKSDEPSKPLRRTDGFYPVAWVRSHGEGRVFYCSLGHSHRTYANPDILKFWLRGVQFATGDIDAETTPSGK